MPHPPKRLLKLVEEGATKKNLVKYHYSLVMLNLVEAMRDDFNKRLDNGEPISNIIGIVHDSIKDAVEFDKERGVQMDCKEGCDRCCRIPVGVTDPEMDLIAEVFKDNPYPQKFKDRLKKQYESDRLKDLNHKDAECIFLFDRGCIIYELRPIPCRLLYSRSVKSCLTGKEREHAVIYPGEAAYAAYLETLEDRGLLNPTEDNMLHRQTYLRFTC